MSEALIAEIPREEQSREPIDVEIEQPSVAIAEALPPSFVDPTEDAYFQAVDAKNSQEHNEDVPIPQPEASDQRSITHWQKFLERRAKIQKKDLASLPSQSYIEQGTLKIDLYSLSAEELRSKLDSAAGIGKKLAEKFALVIEDLKEASQGLSAEQRELMFPLNTAADLMAIEGMGMKRANAVAEALGLEVAVKVEPFDPSFDNLEADVSGFDEESVSDLQNPSKNAVTEEPELQIEVAKEKPNRLLDQLAKGFGEVIVTKGQFDMASLLQKLKEMQQETLKPDATSLGNSGVQQESNQQADTPSTSVIDLKPGEYTVGEGTEVKSHLSRFLDRIPKNLSEGKKNALRIVAGYTLAASLTLTAITTGLHLQEKAPQVTSLIEKLTSLVIKADAPNLNLDGATTAFNQSAQNDSDNPAFEKNKDSNILNRAETQISEVMREPTVDRPSIYAQEFAQNQKAKDALAAVGGAPPLIIGAPNIAPGEAASFTAPPVPPFAAPQVAPENVFKAPESLSTDQIIAAAEKVGIQGSPALEQPTTITNTADQNGDVKDNDIQNSTIGEPNEFFDVKVASTPQTTEATLFMPTLNQRLEKRPSDEVIKSGVLKSGILATEITNNISEWVALEAQNGRELPNDPAAGNAIMRLYMRFNPEIVWTALPPQPESKEISTLEQIMEHQGTEIVVLPSEADRKLYDALLNPDVVDDPVIASILDKMKKGEIDAQNMSAADLETVLRFALNNSKAPEIIN